MVNSKLLFKFLKKRLRGFKKSQGVKLFLLLVILAIGGATYETNYRKVSITPELIQTYAKEIVEICRSEAYRPACYDREIPKLTAKISMEQAFQVTSIVQEKDRSYTYCHVLGHELSAIEVNKDPDNWKEVVSRCPSGLCSNGCIHGGFQEKFRAETFTEQQITEVLPDLKTICEERDSWKPTGLEQGSCYHALGHLTMYLTAADINKSVTMCDQIAKKSDGRNFTAVCYDGVFMQIFQPLEPEDEALIKGKEQTRESVVAFCDQYNEVHKSHCWNESWPLFYKEITTPSGLTNHCSKLRGEYEDRCYNGLVYVVMAQFNLDPVQMLAFCPGLPTGRIGTCFGNAASRMIEVDYRNIPKAVDFCNKSQPSDPSNGCFKNLARYSTFNFKANSPQFFDMCNALPEPWKKECLDRPTEINNAN